uniref:Uncharacterized protein n=1 Tax=Glossina brevipalpis TaxID=37001 RepID=A0A1A9W7B5_9MUSC
MLHLTTGHDLRFKKLRHLRLKHILQVDTVKANPLKAASELMENVNTEAIESTNNVTAHPKQVHLSQEIEETTTAVSKNLSSEETTEPDSPAYAGYLAPESFQEYFNQFGGHLIPYPYYGYAGALAPVYSAPNALSTNNEDLFASKPAVKPSGTFDSIYSTFTNFIDSSFLRVVVTVAVVIITIFLTGAAAAAICNLTPICNVTSNAVNYVRGKGVGDMGQMLVEEMTPERLSRAANFVRSAIDKYQALPKEIETEETN